MAKETNKALQLCWVAPSLHCGELRVAVRFYLTLVLEHNLYFLFLLCLISSY
ncbi:hypothetical protein ERO13_D05G319833v2 [Gossypium hirsutum]|uniref:Uncharacterized protein n=1 Tax=Gossypium barbadense TaxID=3634 RepID=A0A5J5RM84_GOSBA|nr:hypothetical protein ES319_D05G342100v1 [Gossypium barbadense]KAG4149054.1 hypothetical protein ERO13_D05G319833v2 [Gossypium hirsutum]